MEKTLLMVFWKKKPDIFYYGRRTIAWLQTLEWMLKLLDCNTSLNNMIVRRVLWVQGWLISNSNNLNDYSSSIASFTITLYARKMANIINYNLWEQWRKVGEFGFLASFAINQTQQRWHCGHSKARYLFHTILHVLIINFNNSL
jgi:hypothetical protein